MFRVTDLGVTLNITNSTFYNNESYYEGGAFYVDAGNVTLRHVTIADNDSITETGDNIYIDGGSVTLIASIVVNGDCDEDSGTFTDGGNNVQFNAPRLSGVKCRPDAGCICGRCDVPCCGVACH